MAIFIVVTVGDEHYLASFDISDNSRGEHVPVFGIHVHFPSMEHDRRVFYRPFLEYFVFLVDLLEEFVRKAYGFLGHLLYGVEVIQHRVGLADNREIHRQGVLCFLHDLCFYFLKEGRSPLRPSEGTDCAFRGQSTACGGLAPLSRGGRVTERRDRRIKDYGFLSSDTRGGKEVWWVGESLVVF